jgi:aminomethyltransferase
VNDELLNASLVVNGPGAAGRQVSHFKGGFRVTGFHPLMGAVAAGLKLHNTFLKPWRFASLAEEYAALRNAAALFDVTGEEVIEVRGADALRVMDRLVVRDLTRLADGRCVYAVMCYPYGGIVEDGIVVKFSDEHLWWSGGPAASEQWIYQHGLGHDVSVTSRLDDLHVISIQGPRSREILRSAGLPEIDAVPYFGLLADGHLGGVPVIVTRTGYTGELGYDVYVDARRALELAGALLEAGGPLGLTRCGSRTLDVRRVEAGILNVGQDFDWRHTPLDCGLGWMLDLEAEFVGKDALVGQRQRGVASELVGLLAAPGAALTVGDRVLDRAADRIGVVTSAAASPELQRPIAIARVDAGSARAGDGVGVHGSSDGRESVATVAALPFVDPERKRARA